jgi:preprotein translocase subunit SecD
VKSTGRLVGSILVIAALVVAAIVGFLTGVRPQLGLDLVGGVHVVLAGPANADTAVMQRALENIRERVDALGVAEPDISLIGGNQIQVELATLGGQGTVTKKGKQFCAYSSAKKLLGCFARQADAQAVVKAQSIQIVLDIIGRTARLEEREVLSTLSPSQPGYGTTKLTSCPPTGKNAACFDPKRIECPLPPPGTEATAPTGPCTEEKLAKRNVVYFGDDGRTKYRLGPVAITGADLKNATAQFVSSATTSTAQPGWRVVFNLNKDGTRKFADATRRLAPEQKQLAIILDNVIISAPSVNEPITNGTGEITGSFSEARAKDLAVVLNSGSLPVNLERRDVETVSPTLGKESLRQGILAGAAGLVLLMLYLAFYYRLLGVVTWFGMAIWGVLAIGLVSLLGRTIGYSLTLAGVAGIIVSLGITADSYIVFYERLKDEVRHGKSVRAAVVPAFNRSWRTIIAADIVTITAAIVLYLLAIGSVRGFALTLGLSTALDMVVVYFFKRPTVFLLARSAALSNMRGFGLRSGVAGEPVPAVAGGER